MVNLFVACVCYAYGQICVVQDRDAAIASDEDAGDRTEKIKEMIDSCLTPAVAPQDEACLTQLVSGLRLKMRRAFLSTGFEAVLMTLVVFNMALLATYTRDMASWHKSLFEVCEMVFTSLFVVEAMLKLAAFGWRGYVSDGLVTLGKVWCSSGVCVLGWNVFDLVVCLGAAVLLWLDLASASGDSYSGFAVQRPAMNSIHFRQAFRALRLFRVFRSTRGLRRHKSTPEFVV